MRVLVAEDERTLADYVARGLRAESMAVDVVHDGEAALEMLWVSSYDVVVLDRRLPGVSGDEVCRRLVREGTLTRIIMLTAATTVDDRVHGLGLGADDYLVKPFDFAELVARVRALGRRTASALPPVLTRRGIEVNTASREVRRDGVAVAVSPKEYAVLEVLLRARGAVVSAEELLERAWDANTDPFTNAVRVTLSKLRAKLGDPPIIETVPGSGYRL